MLQGTHTRETRDNAREVKFLVPAIRATHILAWARHRLAPDPHGRGSSGDEYQTSTIYFDTADLAVLRRRGSYARSKYRIRRYGRAPLAYLERKLRTRRLLNKRRSAIAAGDIARLLADPGNNPEYAWFTGRVAARMVAPICQVNYRRRALVGCGAFGPLRLTFDDGLEAIANTTATFAAGTGVAVASGYVVMEMKFCVEPPAVLKDLVETFVLSPAPVSKYRLGLAALAGPVVGVTHLPHDQPRAAQDQSRA